MNRASSSLLSHLIQHRNACRQTFREFILASDLLPLLITENSSSFSPTHFESCNKTHKLLDLKSKTHQFQSNACRNLATLVEESPHLSSREKEIEGKSKIKEALGSAKNESLLKVFEDMESSFDEKEHGLACLEEAIKLDQEGKDPEKSLNLANKALEVLDKDGEVSLPLAMTLQVMGSANYRLRRFNSSLEHLNRATLILDKLEKEEDYSVDDTRHVLHAIQLELANTKTAMGRKEEALVHLRRCLELKEMTLDPDSVELGDTNRDLAEAYGSVLNFKEALPFCLKALEIHKVKLGNNSVEVGHDRRLLGIIFSGLEKYDKALEQNAISQKIFRSLGLSSDLLHAEIDAANLLIALGKDEKAVNILKCVIQLTEKESETRALVFISMAKALCNQGQFADAKRCMELSYGILDKKEIISPLLVAEAYMETSMLYETMTEFETAISLLKRSLAILETLPQEKHSGGSVSARLGWLLLLTGKVPQAVPYLETAAEILKESFGSRHFGMGYVYNNLGAAYLELNRPQSAAQMFSIAKDIMDVSFGPHHADSIEACQNLSKAYNAMGSYTLAMKFQQQVIEAWETRGSSAQDECREAHRLLEQLKRKAGGSSSDVVTTKALPLPHTKTLRPDV